MHVFACVCSPCSAHPVHSEPEPKADKSPYGTPYSAAATAVHGVKTDPLAILAKQMGGSKRNALLKWCQSKTNAFVVTTGYKKNSPTDL